MGVCTSISASSALTAAGSRMIGFISPLIERGARWMPWYRRVTLNHRQEHFNHHPLSVMFSPSLLQSLWSLRESIPLGLASKTRLRQNSKLFKYDVSVSLSKMEYTVDGIMDKLHRAGFGPGTEACMRIPHQQHLNSSLGFTSSTAGSVHVFCFGHVGDQNLHLNLIYTP